MSCEPPGDSLGAQASQGRVDEGIGPYVFCRRTDCDRREPSERVRPVYPLVCNGIFYTTARTTPSDSQWSSDTRPACARIGCRPSRPRTARRGSRGVRALFFSFCADTERYPTANRYRTSLRTHWLSALPTTHRLRRLAARESACPPADRCSWHRNALPSSHTGFPDSKSAGCPSPDP